MSACTCGSSAAQNVFGLLEDADDPPLAAAPPPLATSELAADASPPQFATSATATTKHGLAPCSRVALSTLRPSHERATHKRLLRRKRREYRGELAERR